MNELIVKDVNFQGTTLLAIQDKDTKKIYAGINLILRDLGFDERQIEYRRNKWNTDKVISKGVQKFSYPLEKGGIQEAYCIDIMKLPLALAKIEITPKMEKEMPDLSLRLEIYQERCADVLANEFIVKEKQSAKSTKKKNLSAVNMMIKNVSDIFTKAGVDPLYIAVATKNIYEEAGYSIPIQLTTKEKKLYDCTEMAKELGILSKTGKPHDKAVSGILQQIGVLEEEKVTTPFARNGHDDVTVQYKESVFLRVKQWLIDSNYPAEIPLRLSNGNTNKCKVTYKKVEVA